MHVMKYFINISTLVRQIIISDVCIMLLQTLYILTAYINKIVGALAPLGDSLNIKLPFFG